MSCQPRTGSKENVATKTLVRNCRSRSTVPALSSSQPVALSESEPNRRVGGSERTNSINLTEPQYHTTRLMKENLDKMKVGMKSVRFEKKSPDGAQTKGVSKKVNIRFDEKIYKDLIDLKVTDEDLGLRPISTVRTREMSRNREPAPELSDYYRPKFNKEYIVKPHQPDWSNLARTRRTGDSQSTVWKAVKRWSVDDDK